MIASVSTIAFPTRKDEEDAKQGLTRDVVIEG